MGMKKTIPIAAGENYDIEPAQIWRLLEVWSSEVANAF